MTQKDQILELQTKLKEQSALIEQMKQYMMSNGAQTKTALDTAVNANDGIKRKENSEELIYHDLYLLDEEIVRKPERLGEENDSRSPGQYKPHKHF